MIGQENSSHQSYSTTFVAKRKLVETSSFALSVCLHLFAIISHWLSLTLISTLKSSCVYRIQPKSSPNTHSCSIFFCSFGLLSSFLLGDCLLSKCAYNANCVTQKDGTASCSCSLLCSSSFRPVCGSNSRTYWNECFLRREACFMQQNTSVAFLERCSKFSCTFHF